MLGNGRQVTIPKEQLGIYKCTSCKDEVFRIVSGVSFVYDKLNPKGRMIPQPVTMYQCMKCKGFLQIKSDGTPYMVHLDGETHPGDEWKKL